MAGQYWVTWKDESDGTAARKSALLWGPQANAPAQVSGYLQAGPFATKADAQAYENQIGTGAILPAPGTPIIGNKTAPGVLTGLSAIGDFFSRLSQGSTWIRVAEVGLAVILIAVGVARITHAVPVATKIAKTAGAVAIA